MMGVFRGVALRLADSRLTLAFFVLTVGAVLAIGPWRLPATPWMVLPFALLVLNLLAATWTHRRLRVDFPLLVFHLALLALVSAIVGSRLTYCDAQFAVSSGTDFDGQVLNLEHGPLHSGRIDSLRFASEGFRVWHDAEGRPRETYNRISWIDAAGRPQAAEIGEGRSAYLNGYRLSLEAQRGLAPLFRWQPTGQVAELASMQLPYNKNTDELPSGDWTLADGSPIWVQVRHDPRGAVREQYVDNLGVAELPHRLIVRSGEQRFELGPGDTIDLSPGRLTYLGLGAWMGYRVVFDPLADWIMASILVAIGSLIWFYARLFLGKGAAA